MSLHVLERLSVQLGLAGVVSAGLAQLGAIDLELELLKHVPPEAWWAAWPLFATLVAIRFAAVYGRRVKRTPAGELSRCREELRKEFLEQLAAARKEWEKDNRRLDRRVSRIEGNLGALVVANGDD